MTHKPNPICNNQLVESICNIVKAMVPDITINSVLINYYPAMSSYIPLHADNEPAILADSYILTLSFGDTRHICFHSFSKAPNELCKIELRSWELLLFSRASQNIYKHAVPADVTNYSYGRISLTFRCLQEY